MSKDDWKDTDWPCKKCKSKNVRKRSYGSDDYDDWKYECKDCGHTWIEEGSDY